MQIIRSIGLALALPLALGACASQGTPGPTSSSAITSSPSAPAVGTAPTDPVAAAAWEALMSADGEYAASAAYSAVIARYGPVEPYVSIQAAEERHVSALTRQLQRLGVAVPPNPYTGTIPAPPDLTTAAKAWADGEVANVAMYDRLLASAASDPTLVRVLGNLRRASQDVHLPAFRAAAANGGQLTAAQMTALGLG